MTIIIVRSPWTWAVAAACAALPTPVRSDTPGQIPQPWTYEGSMKLQEQQQQQPQANTPSGQPGMGSARGAGNGGAAGAALEAARRNWLKRPALPPDRNPLLNTRWTRPATTQARGNDPFAGLLALAQGGLCEALFGGGTFEFRPDTLVGMDARHEEELDHVEYRGDAHHVVVIPRTTIRLMEFDVEGPGRINWASQKCVLVKSGGGGNEGHPLTSRAGGGANGSAGAGVNLAALPPTAAGPGATTGGATAGMGAGGVLSLSLNSLTPGSINIAGRALWVLRKDAQAALLEGGFPAAPDATSLQSWVRACASHAPGCQQGAQVLKGYTIGVATTDANGHAQSPPLPAGRYWVMGDGRVDNRHMLWNVPVEVTARGGAVTLDARNAVPVD